MKVLESTAGWRRMGDFFLVVVIPLFHAVGGYFVLQFVLSGDYTWGRTLRTFALLMGNLVMGYEFVYRDLQAAHPEWSSALLKKSVMKYSVIPVSVGMAASLIFQVLRDLAR
jgi:hypothetical protein